MKAKTYGWLAPIVAAALLAPAVWAQGGPGIPQRPGKLPKPKLPPSRIMPKFNFKKPRVVQSLQKKPPLVTFAGGELIIGENSGGVPAARPAHKVVVKPFKLQRHEVTVAEYKDCVAKGKCTTPRTGPGCNWNQAGRENHPINCVDWYQAEAYCKAVGMRLPSEEEWEVAARGPRGRAYPWGQQTPLKTDICWNGKSTCAVATSKKDRTPKGLEDMAGNVREWTASPFCPYRTGGCATTLRTVRGGSWYDSDTKKVRASFRDGFNKGVRSSLIGFRCAMDIPKKP